MTTIPRRWLQVAGLPVTREIEAVRAEIDRLTHVEVLPQSSRVILYDPEGVIGALDLMPVAKTRVDQATADPDPGEEKPAPDPAKGDTVIIPFDPTNPDHANALKGARVSVSDAYEPEHIELPDYERPPRTAVGRLAGAWQRFRIALGGAVMRLGLWIAGDETNAD